MLRFIVPVLCMLLTSCSATEVNNQAAQLGTARTLDELEHSLNEPGPITFKKLAVANWQVPLSGLLNLEHPKAHQAGLHDRLEAIQIYTYVLEHPLQGTYLVDSGVSERFAYAAANPDVSFLVRKAMKTDGLELLKSTRDLLKETGEISGVLLTHIHIDHIMGLPDVDAAVPVYTGPGEAKSKLLTHLATRGTVDRHLANVDVLREWQFDEHSVLDVFGDGSLWAIHVPGHTPGATAYLARTTGGAQLMIGDATHTRWGWDNQVEPGSYSKDKPQSARSLALLVELVKRNPHITVHPGHQP